MTGALAEGKVERPDLLLYRCPIEGDWEPVEAGDDLTAALATVLAVGPDTASVWAVHRDDGDERWRYSRPQEALGGLKLFKTSRRSVHVVGASQIAIQARAVLTADAVPGWTLHLTQDPSTPLTALQPLLTNRYYGLLERNGFTTVEEVEATPESGLAGLRSAGPKFLIAVSNGLAQLGPAGASLTAPAPPEELNRRRQLLAQQLQPGAALRNSGFVDLLARSSIPVSALGLIIGSLNAEPVPPADPTVLALLETAGESTLLARYAGTRRHDGQQDAGSTETRRPEVVYTYRSPVHGGGGLEPDYAEDIISAVRGVLIECVALGRDSGSISAAHHDKGQRHPFRYGGTGLGEAMLFRTGDRSVHVVGDSQVATEARQALGAGDVPGWSLHPVRGSRTPLQELRTALPTRTYRVLSRSGFSTVEEVEATPDAGLRRLRGAGDKLIGGLRAAIADLAGATAGSG